MRVVDIIDGTTVDGPGFRTSIYFAGCNHHCPQCHNPSTWDPASGIKMTISEIMQRINHNDFDVTFSGGDPLLQIDQLIELAKRIKTTGRNIWCYTGYDIEQIISNRHFLPLLEYVDVIVDGRFMANLRDTSLLFRGSSNQRLIDIGHWRKTGQLRSWESDF